MNPFKNYNIGFLTGDLMGGVSVAALSIPIGVAYAEIAGLPPESGIYTAVLALVAYFILGTSSQAIIGTDFATVTLFAATVVAAFGRDHGSAPQFMMLITVMTGLLMFAGGLLRLGFIANFLSEPIMLGYLNGVSIMLIDSQLGKITGLNIEETGLLRRMAEIFQKASFIHRPTLLLGVISLIFLHLFKKIPLQVPGPLLLIIITAVAAQLFDFRSLGVAFMPEMQNLYPNIIIPDVGLLVGHFPDVFLGSVAVMFVAYSSEIPVVQGFTKDHSSLDPNREFYALGLAHVLIGLFGGYPVSGDDSRTAVNVAVGGNTKLVNLIAAVSILLVIFLIPGILTTLPLVTIAVIIAYAGIAMFERGAGLRLFRIDKGEFLVFAVCVVGVLTLGVYQGILFAIVLAIVQLVKQSSKPSEIELVYDERTRSVMPLAVYSGPPVANVFIYRFASALLFYNVAHFLQRVSLLSKSKKELALVIVDATPINMIDLTARYALRDWVRCLSDNGVRVAFAGANQSFESAVRAELNRHDLDIDIFFPSVPSVFQGRSEAVKADRWTT